MMDSQKRYIGQLMARYILSIILLIIQGIYMYDSNIQHHYVLPGWMKEKELKGKLKRVQDYSCPKTISTIGINGNELNLQVYTKDNTPE